MSLRRIFRLGSTWIRLRMRRGRRWRGWDLLQRRYSVPETVMRKYALSRGGSWESGTSTTSGSTSGCGCSRVDRGVQTSPGLGPGQRARSYPERLPSLGGFRPLSGGPSWAPEDTPSPPAPWTSSSATLSQTVSDRTTSTQDSTLSLPSATPDRPPRLLLDPQIFSPAGGTIVVNSESSLVRPVELTESRSHFTFGSSGSSHGDPGSPVPSSPTMEAASVVSRQASTVVDVGVNTETESVVEDRDGGEAGAAGSREETECETAETMAARDSKRSVGCQAEETDPPLSDSAPRDRQARLEYRFFGAALETTSSWEAGERGDGVSVPRVSCAGRGNYEDPPGCDLVVPRYSAVPRTGSMLVNTSSVDYTSDSDLSLTDSLEDAPPDRRPLWPATKHDNRLVRGEVNTHEEINTKKKYIKSKNTYAYFLFLSGEEDVIKEYSVPEKLKSRLKQREEEIKKHFETKFAAFKKHPYRKRKKLKFVRKNSDTNSSEPRESKLTANRNGLRSQGVSKSTQCSKSRPVSERSSPDAKQSQNNRYENSSKRKSILTKDKKVDPELDKTIANILISAVEVGNNSIMNKKNTDKRDLNWNLNGKSSAISVGVGTSPTDLTSEPMISEEKDIDMIHSWKVIDDELQAGNVLTESVGTNVDMDDLVRDAAIGTQDSLEDRFRTPTAESSPETLDQGVQFAEKSSSPIWACRGVQTTDSLPEDTPPEKIVEQSNWNKGVQVCANDVREAIEDITNNNTEAITEKSSLLVPQIRIESIEDPSMESLEIEEEEAGGLLRVPDPETYIRTENDKNVINSLTTAFSQATKKEGTCLRNKSGKSGNAEILEINVPVCTCHMCTFEKMTASPRERAEARQMQMMRNRPSPSPQMAYPTKQQEKRMAKPVLRRNPNPARFQQRFEVIPEEKNSSVESSSEEQSKPLDLSPEWKRDHFIDYGCRNASKAGNARLYMSPHMKNTNEILYRQTNTADNFQTSRKPRLTFSDKNVYAEDEFEDIPGNISSDEPQSPTHSYVEVEKKKVIPKPSRVNLATRNQVKIPQLTGKRQSVVIGRFKAESRTEKDSENVRQYKGRAALAAQEELVTLSKGWINFYLLRDSQEIASEPTTPEKEQKASESKVPDSATMLRNREKKKEEVVKQYTVEIQAAPEPSPPPKGKSGLPDLRTKRTKRREKPPAVTEDTEFCLPDIPSSTSSSSSSPESVIRPLVSPTSPNPPKLPELRKEKNGSRREVKKQRKEKHSPSPDHSSKHLLRLPQGNEVLPRGVEVAHSEHSVSSVTSSTMILSESPPPPDKVRLPERRLQRHKHQKTSTHTTQQTTCINNTGNSWSVTVAGTSGSSSQPPPDVEMKLTFGKRDKGSGKERLEAPSHSNELVQYSQPPNATRNHTNRTSRQQERSTEVHVDTLRNEHHPLRCLPEPPSTARNTKKETGLRARSGLGRDIVSRTPSVLDCSHPFQRNFCRMCNRDQKDSGSENTFPSGCGDLQLTGMAITPEQKPRVPTQSERDILRARRYRFT